MAERNSPEQYALPAQAAEVFHGISELIALCGKDYGDTRAYGEVPVDTPADIALHFPETDNTSLEVRHAVYVSQKYDWETREPKRSGVVGIVTFDHKDQRDAGLLYATHVNYHVITDDGETYRLERHVTNTEHGPHRVAMQAAKAFTTKSLIDTIAELTAVRDRVEATRDLERSTGLIAVSLLEAEQILNVLTQELEAKSPEAQTGPGEVGIKLVGILPPEPSGDQYGELHSGDPTIIASAHKPYHRSVVVELDVVADADLPGCTDKPSQDN